MLVGNPEAISGGEPALKLFKATKDNNSDILDVFYGPVDDENISVYPEGGEANYKSLEWYTLAMSNQGKVVITQPIKSVEGKYAVAVAKGVEKDGNWLVFWE